MMTEKLLAWYGSQPLKEEVMERLRKHRADDAIVQDIYQRVDPTLALGYRGCAIGCTLPPRPVDNRIAPDKDGFQVVWPDDWHGEVERLYGIRYEIGYAIDCLFEALDPDDCGDFAVQVIDAIPVGADLTEVAQWARAVSGYTPHAKTLSAELIERLSAAPVPIPA